MAKGTGTYDDPILVDGLFTKTINGVKKFFKIKTVSSVDTSQFIKKSGDVLTGTHFTRNVDNEYIYIGGGINQSGAGLICYGKDMGATDGIRGSIELRTKSDLRLKCQDDGVLLWNNQNIVRTVNGAVADKNGNVSDIAEKGEGYIRFTNGLQICFSSANTSNPNISFSKPFSRSPLIFCSGVGNAHGWGSSNITPTGFTAISSDKSPGQYCYFFVIGYWN